MTDHSPPDDARSVDADFLALPLDDLADASLSVASTAGASYAAFRLERTRGRSVRLRDAEVEGVNDSEDLGYSVRVLVDGVWGFASGTDRTSDGARATARRALEVAELSRPLVSSRLELAPEPSHGRQEWVSQYRLDPFAVPDSAAGVLLADWSRRLLAAPGVDHVDAELTSVKEQKFYADLAGTVTTQQRVRIQPELTAFAVDSRTGAFDSMRTCAPPAGRGYEYLEGDGWDWQAELEQIPVWLAEKLAAPSVEPGRYDLVIEPSNLFLTIHESIGHATELDRALGYEANYAGMSFATPDGLGSLRYGSDLMNVTGDRCAPFGLSTVGYDDEGVSGQQFDIVRDGVLVGYQLDRSIAGRVGWNRSNGCAFADSAGHAPIQRMPNVSLQPAADGPTTEALIAGVEDGLYVVGDKSWSIDMQRYNFQFTGQRFFRIRSGRIVGAVKDVAYQATTTDFWGSMVAVGGPQTYLLGGALNCGKGQPAQVAPVSHGCPTAVFQAVNVLNTAQEGSR